MSISYQSLHSKVSRLKAKRRSEADVILDAIEAGKASWADLTDDQLTAIVGSSPVSKWLESLSDSQLQQVIDGKLDYPQA